MENRSVLEQTDLLKDLQNIDLEISRCKTQKSKLLKEQEGLDADVDRIQNMIDSLSSDLEDLKEERQGVTRALTQEQDNVSRAEQRLPTIKTQKEYVAVLKEIDTAKKMNKDLQDRMAEKEKSIAALEEDKRGKEEELAALNGQLDERRSEIRQSLEAAENSLGEKEQEREKIFTLLPAGIRRRYPLLLDRRGGIAIVEARQGTCTGCHMHLPPQVYNNLFRAQEIQSCPHCNRMLFVLGEA